MFHKDLKVNGKRITAEAELESFFSSDQFTCEIRDTVLQVEYSEERAAWICWLKDDEEEIYYLDSGSGDEEPYELINDTCPEERMMCYDEEAIRDIILYFCKTGGRSPRYSWTEDDFNWTDYVPKRERMFDKRHLPELYEAFHKLGFLTYPGENYVWMSEMEWIPYEEVLNYKAEKGVTQAALPFAIMGSGDPWVFIENGSCEPYIGCYYHPEEEGEYCAANFEDVILRNIIEYAEDAAVFLDESGNPQNPFEKAEDCLEKIQEQLQEYCRVFKDLLRPSYLEVIAHLAKLPFKKCSFNGSGLWLALLSHEEADALIRQYLDFEKMGKPFVWYEDDLED